MLRQFAGLQEGRRLPRTAFGHAAAVERRGIARCEVRAMARGGGPVWKQRGCFPTARADKALRWRFRPGYCQPRCLVCPCPRLLVCQWRRLPLEGRTYVPLRMPRRRSSRPAAGQKFPAEPPGAHWITMYARPAWAYFFASMVWTILCAMGLTRSRRVSSIRLSAALPEGRPVRDCEALSDSRRMRACRLAST